ncbi:mucin-2-like isoform X2 [Homalodisca vitripennis]|uniref:mucin-2-like isoform X2 n=1 Tax=Homalodisca vitripennis TaxID=197043 RepID=UPI001EEB85E5|nr:mucin-2-like isoform X2 [Homalodisca vitripennis]
MLYIFLLAGFAWVTLATNDSYSLGALVLAHSLRRVNTAHQLVVLITPGVTEAMKTQLSAVFNIVKLVDVLDSKDADNLALLARPELGITFTKLHCWRLTQFDKCVFLDADTLVLQNSDELFEREELSAAPDAGWPDCFNSGVFVYKPSDETYKALIEFALIHGSFDGGDQGLLNLFFSDWPTKDIKKHLPFVYNMCSTATYSYLPAFKQYGQGLKIIHFIGTAKPWLQPFNTETGLASVSGVSQNITQFVQLWWDLFCTSVHPSLSTEMAGLAGALASVTLGAPLSAEQTALEEHLRRQGWEQGNIDYMGKDSFANIWQKICDTLASVPRQIPAEETPAPVAPVAAPVYVSSVEISPTGPIDTSPPASYAPVSAPKPTVVASDNEVASKATEPAEAVTVVPELKSSVAELISTESTVVPSASLDSSAQTSTPVPAINSETPAVAALPQETLETAVKTSISPDPIESVPLVQTETPSVASAPDTSLAPLAPIATPTPPQSVLSTKELPTDPTAETATPVLPANDNLVSSQVSVVSEAPAPITSDQIPTQIQAVQGETTTVAQPPITSPAPVEVPLLPDTTVPPVSAPIEIPLPVQPLSETPVLPASKEDPSISVKEPVIPSAPLETAIQPQATVVSPLTETSTPVPPVEVKAPNSQSTIEIPAPTSPVPVAAETTVITTPEATVPAIPESITQVSQEKPSEPSVETPKALPGEEKVTESLTPVQPVIEPTPPTSPSAVPTETTKTPVEAQQKTPITSHPLDSTLVQPDTPTVTEPTPPTSPPTAPVESPLATKLKVDSELPATPPVGSSAQPSLVASTEEPPVPPKRKGGAKANQDGKNQKSGKQSKGKK